MTETTYYQIWPELSNLPERLAAIAEFARKRGRSILRTGSGFNIKSASNRHIGCATWAELLDAAAKYPNPVGWDFWFSLPAEDEVEYNASLSVWIQMDARQARIQVQASDADTMVVATQFLEAEFGFKTLPDFTPDRRRFNRPPQAKAFIGCHFDEAGLSAATKIQTFLKLLRFDTVQIGDRYEGRAITEKVRAGIADNEIYVGVITGHRDHDWITAETGLALGSGKHLILIAEEGTNYQPTIEGKDFEQVRFRRCVEESFIPLLQLFRSMGVVGI